MYQLILVQIYHWPQILLRKKSGIEQKCSPLKNPRWRPKLGVLLRVYKIKIEGNKIEACGLFRSTEGHNKMILQKKKWKKVENSNFGGLFKFEISDFFNFWTFFFTFSIFPMKMWYLRYTRNYVIFRTFNYEENGRKKLKKCWKVTILQFFYKILHMLKKNRTFWVKLKI